jgi:hypothetical protein
VPEELIVVEGVDQLTASHRYELTAPSAPIMQQTGKGTFANARRPYQEHGMHE